MNTLVPKTAVLELTYRCNHRCRFCSVPWESPRKTYEQFPELSLDEWKRCIDTLAALGVSAFAFSGGEPLLKEGFAELLAYARTKKTQEPVFDERGRHAGFAERDVTLSVITNGELADKPLARLLKRHRSLVHVSLPGLDNFSDLTGGGNAGNALKAIRIFSDEGLDTVVNVCVTKINLPELFETIAAGFLSGAKQLLLNRFLPGGRGLANRELALSKEEIARMLDAADEACTHANTFGSTGTELPKCMVNKTYRMLSVSTKCSGGEDFFAVDPSGFVRPCNHTPVRLGRYTGLPRAIGTDYWQTFKRKDFLPAMCSGCASILDCDAGCREAAHIIGGSLHSPDPVFQ